jgi:hypothetical protein
MYACVCVCMNVCVCVCVRVCVCDGWWVTTKKHTLAASFGGKPMAINAFLASILREKEDVFEKSDKFFPYGTRLQYLR